ncbi:MAG: branched-chain amino acid ABC transporter permease [Propylenella sp.]
MIGQAIADGLLTGAILALGAIGISLSLQILRFANFGHGDVLTLGAYGALTFTGVATAGASIGPVSFGWQFLIAVVIAGVVAGAAAILIDMLVYSRLRSRRAHNLTMIFASFGVALVLRNLVLLTWGPDVHYYTNELQIAVRILPNVRVMPDQIFVLALALVLVIALYCALRYTRLGMAMRAMAENPALAGVCGVETRKVIRISWFVAGALAGMAGAFLGLTVQLRPEMGFNLLLAILTAAILGGTGSLFGAVAGGLLVGLAENLSVLVIPAGYKAAMPFLLLLLVLYLRPQGIFGSLERSWR